MLPYREHAHTPAPRFGEILAALVIALFAVLLFVFAIYMTLKILSQDNIELGPTVFTSVAALLGVFFGVTAYRLATGKGRGSDGGLFPPWLLRVLGLMFLVGSAFLAYVTLRDREYAIGAILAGLSIGLGCFYLANRQERVTHKLSTNANDT